MSSENITNREPYIIFAAIALGMLLSIITVYIIAELFELPEKNILKGFVYSTIVIVIVGLFSLVFSFLVSKDNQTISDTSHFNNELDCIYIAEYRKRLLSYHHQTFRNSIVNLTIALSGAGITIVFLIYFLSNERVLTDGMKGEHVAYYYISRFFAILFINLLVVFFLRLYKQNLSDIKFFQNELSNTDSKLIALHYAKNENNKNIYYFILKELGKTERNYILKKGETTVELEKFKFDKSEHHSLIEIISNILQKIKNK